MKRTKKRLLELLDQRDKQITEMSETIERLEREVNGAVWAEWLPREMPENERFPVPRLEIEIVENRHPKGWHLGIVCIYRLVYRHLTGTLRSIPLGRTTSSGTTSKNWTFALNSSNWPFRDSAHIHHDAAHLGLPGFLRYGDEYLPLDNEGYADQVAMGIERRVPEGEHLTPKHGQKLASPYGR